MHELTILALVVVIAMAVTAAGLRWIGPAVRVLEEVLLAGSVALIAFVAFFVGAEVVMRYAFNSPIPGHLEGSELLMPVIVFLALSYTQSTHGHVGMDLVLDNLSPRLRRYASMAVLGISIFICAVLCYFATKHTLQLVRYDDVTMSPPYFHTWPSAAAIALGYGLVSLRMCIQVLHLYDPRRFPAHEPPAGGFHAAE